MTACLHLPEVHWQVHFSTHLLSVNPAPFEDGRGDTPEVGYIVLIQTPLNRHQPIQHLQRPSWISQEWSPAHSKRSHNHQSQLGNAKNLCQHGLTSWHSPDWQETGFAAGGSCILFAVTGLMLWLMNSNALLQSCLQHCWCLLLGLEECSHRPTQHDIHQTSQ